MFFEIISGDKVDPSVQECVEGFLELEAKEAALQATLNETFGQVIKLQTKSLAGQGDSKELKAAQARLDDLQQKFEAIRSGMEAIKGSLAGRILTDARHRLADGIPSELSAIGEEKRALHREFLSTCARAAVLQQRIRGGGNRLPMKINFDFSTLDSSDKELYAELVRKESEGCDLTFSCSRRIQQLNTEAGQLEKQIESLAEPAESEKVVSDLLRKAGSKLFPAPEVVEPEYEMKTRSYPVCDQSSPDEETPGEWSKEARDAYYNNSDYRERKEKFYRENIAPLREGPPSPEPEEPVQAEEAGAELAMDLETGN